MSRGEIFLICIAFVVIVLALDYFGILWGSVTRPMREEVRREVWENTPSYVMGVEQDLANFKRQWDAAEPGSAERTAVEATIRSDTRFTHFDETDINSTTLREWFVSIRGY